MSTETSGVGVRGRLDQVADVVMGAANVVATLWILWLMVLIVSDVIGRETIGQPIAGVPEMVKFSIVGIVFLQIAHTHRKGEMIRSDGILGMVRARWPRAGLAMDLFAQLCGAAFASTLAWAVWPKVIRAYERGEMEGVQGHFTMPVWPFLFLIVLGAILLAVSFLLTATAEFKEYRTA
ncbi:MAG: C4-dicarboxylate ABC transporter permease [Pseudooceanicola sp.]|jgi:TRAP-type mannitol/chloroaromatic compound transport system permease small subunit|nr:C4-dicarboxylate ABC transporter permease [Pseudooceanicola sp.]